MKFRISKEALLEGLSQVIHVVSTRATLAILSNVLIRAKGGRLQLTTTDLDVGITGFVEADVDKEGSTTLPAKKILGIVRELPDAEVEITVDSKHIATITCGAAFFKVNGMKDEEFPLFPDFTGAREYKVPQADLLDSLRKTSYAISSDETRYVLNGVFASFRDGKLTLVATDGRRLAMAESDLEVPTSHEADIIIPTKAVNELQRLINGTGELVMRLNENQVSFQVGDSTLVTKLIEGNYPNYRQVIPGEANERVELPRLALLETLRRVVSLLTTEKSNSVKLHFHDNKLEISANSPDVGEAHEEIPVKYEARSIQVAYNPEFMMAPLKNLDTDTVYLDLIDEMSPGVIRIDGSFLYVIMPMRVTA